MSPKNKNQDMESQVDKVEIVEASISAETKVAGAVAQTPEKAAEVDAVPRVAEMETGKVNLGDLSRNLYQMGLDLGLAPDEAALLTAETRLPTFVSDEGQGEFKRGLISAYQEMLDGRLQSLKQQLGVD